MALQFARFSLRDDTESVASMCRNLWREYGCYSCLCTLPRFNCRYPFKSHSILVHQIQISASNANSKPFHSQRVSTELVWKGLLQLPRQLHLICSECISRMNCNLVGASEMGEHGLDQLKVPCVTVGKPFWKRNAGFAGVVTVTAVSAFESYEVISKSNREIKITTTLIFLLC